jgi:lysophospholipid acyltransferase (LPLAT)-like uncharacterized protein
VPPKKKKRKRLKLPSLRKQRWKRRPGMLNVAGWGLAAGIRAWLGTLRVHIDAVDYAFDPRFGASGNIYCIWHEDLLFLAHFFRDCDLEVMISRSTDGEIITRTVQYLGYKAVRGSTGRGGGGAVLEMMRNRESRNTVLTTDGPRGPRRELQLGAIYLASRLGMPIVPAMAAYDRAWRSRSWDKMAFPRPFSKAVICTGPCLYVPPDLDQAGLESQRQRIENEMHALTARAENIVAEWTAGRPLPAPAAANVPERYRKSA